MRWDIEKAAQFIRKAQFEYLEGLEFTEDERALIDAILYLEREYYIDAVTDLKATNTDLRIENHKLRKELGWE